MNLYLNNQKRDRHLEEYINKLCVCPICFHCLNSPQKDLMLVGGGKSTQSESFLYNTIMKIVNIDYDPPKEDFENRIQNLKGDFYRLVLNYTNCFDEIWSLYSLPLYSPTAKDVKLFFYRCVISLKNHGVLRVFPIEEETVNKMHTRDADYDMTSFECRESVFVALNKLKQYGIQYEIIRHDNEDLERKEDTIIISIDFTDSDKDKLNILLLNQCDKLLSEDDGYMTEVNIVN